MHFCMYIFIIVKLYPFKCIKSNQKKLQSLIKWYKQILLYINLFWFDFLHTCVLQNPFKEDPILPFKISNMCLAVVRCADELYIYIIYKYLKTNTASAVKLFKCFLNKIKNIAIWPMLRRIMYFFLHI